MDLKWTRFLKALLGSYRKAVSVQDGLHKFQPTQDDIKYLFTFLIWEEETDQPEKQIHPPLIEWNLPLKHWGQQNSCKESNSEL